MNIKENLKNFKKKHQDTMLLSKNDIKMLCSDLKQDSKLSHVQILNLIANEYGMKNYKSFAKIIQENEKSTLNEYLQSDININDFKTSYALLKQVKALIQLGTYSKSKGILKLEDEVLNYSFKRFRFLIQDNDINSSIKINDFIDILNKSNFTLKQNKFSYIKQIENKNNSIEFHFEDCFNSILLFSLKYQ